MRSHEPTVLLGWTASVVEIVEFNRAGSDVRYGYIYVCCCCVIALLYRQVRWWKGSRAHEGGVDSSHQSSRMVTRIGGAVSEDL
jgi:hypothetical protein